MRGNKYKISNIKSYFKKRGWVCGQFFPEWTIEHNNDFEAKLVYLSPGDSDDEHYHPRGREVNFIIEGKVHWRIDGEEVMLGPGDVVHMESNVREEIIEVVEPTTIVSIRAPSLPDNKVYSKTKSE